MVLYQKPIKTKASGSGGRRRAIGDKRLAHYGGFRAIMKISKTDKEHRDVVRTKGGNITVKPKALLFANVVIAGKTKKAKILTVKETPSNRHYARENVIVKGAIVETDAGLVRVTSRPGQDGIVNAVLVKN